MLTTHPRLCTRRPSPTTIEFTVSTSPTLTLPLRLLLLLIILIRILVGLSVLLLLYSKYLLSSYASLSTAPRDGLSGGPPPIFSVEYILYLLNSITTSRPGQLAKPLSTATPLTLLLPLSLLTLYLCLLRPHTTESLLVLRGLGIQTSSSSSTYLSTATTRFIPTEKIQDILVNEAFRGFEVRYYLVVVVEGEEEVVVVFPRLLPRRGVVETVWRGARECLFEPGGGVGGGEKGGRDKGKGVVRGVD